ncbi:MAG: hypothetical protein DBY30_02820 [Verrucomicrobia bacterium]|nr:MAG: hypothetical protein DBY30_02820 [Verrucomicrobiota bacterium]
MEKWRTFGPTVIFELNPFEARLHHPSKKIKISDFFRQILLLPHPLSQKNIPPKSQSKSCTDIFPLNVRHFPQNKKPHRRKTSDSQRRPQKIRKYMLTRDGAI